MVSPGRTIISFRSKSYFSPSAPCLTIASMRKTWMTIASWSSAAVTSGQRLRRTFAAGCWRSSAGCSPWSCCCCWMSSPAGSSWTSCSSPAGEQPGIPPAGTGFPRCEPPHTSPLRSLSTVAASSLASSKSSAQHLKSLQWRLVAGKSWLVLERRFTDVSFQQVKGKHWDFGSCRKWKTYCRNRMIWVMQKTIFTTRYFSSHLWLEFPWDPFLDGSVHPHWHHLDRACQVFPANLQKVKSMQNSNLGNKQKEKLKLNLHNKCLLSKELQSPNYHTLQVNFYYCSYSWVKMEEY